LAGASRLQALLLVEMSTGSPSERRAGLLSDLMDAAIDGEPLSPAEIIPYFGTILAAGAETTMRSTLNALLALLLHPDQANAIRQSPDLTARAVEETLRWEPPIPAVFRQASRDCTIGGVPVAAGAPVIVWIASANHDELVFEEPEVFDIHRQARAQLGFGFGPHLCIGMHLARVETATAVATIMNRFPDIRLDPAATVPEIVGTSFRSPVSLPVVW
jgi:cytochrome P450